MKTNFLFPHQFKKLGWIVLSLGIICICVINKPFAESLHAKVFAIADGGILGEPAFFSSVDNAFFDELTIAFLIMGSILVGFSKCREEDELISKIRYESLVWAVYLNFGLLLFATLFIFGSYYMSVVLHNIFSLLIFFILRFHIKLYQLKKSLRDDE